VPELLAARQRDERFGRGAVAMPVVLVDRPDAPQVHGNVALDRVQLVGDRQHLLQGELPRDLLDHPPLVGAFGQPLLFVGGLARDDPAQRLVRRLCKHCREPYEPDRDKMPADFPWQRLEGRPLYRQVGCRECRHVGYSGRMGSYELLLTDNNIRQLAHDRASTWQIKQAAVKQGMRTLRDDGWTKAMAGQKYVFPLLGRPCE
jgi:hypothetical protein